MRKTICFVTIGDMKESVVAKRALGMAEPLVRLGWGVTIVIKDTEENHHQIALNCSESVHVVYFPNSSISAENRFKKVIVSKLKPDFVYLSVLNYRNLFATPKSTKVIVEHCELYSKYNNLRLHSKLLALFFEYYSILYSDGLVVASRFLERIYTKRKGYFHSIKPMLYLPYAFSNTIRTNVVKKSKDLIKKEQFTFVYLGSIRESYGVFTIIDAVRNLKEQYLFKIYMLGTGADLEKAKEYVNQQDLDDYFDFCGYVEEEKIPTYFQMADAFLSPMNDTIQDWARCPSKLYMYLPYKKPVITCKIGEPYETLKEEGLYYEPSDSCSLASSMEKVLNGERMEININADDFSWDASARVFDKWAREF